MTAAQVEQENIALVKRGYEAFGRGDMATLRGLYEPGAVFYTTPHDDAEGTYLGRDAIFAYFGELFSESEGTFKATPVAMAAADDRVFVLQELSGKRKGHPLQENTVMVFTIDHALLREMREFVTPQSGLKAFWSD